MSGKCSQVSNSQYTISLPDGIEDKYIRIKPFILNEIEIDISNDEWLLNNVDRILLL